MPDFQPCNLRGNVELLCTCAGGHITYFPTVGKTFSRILFVVLGTRAHESLPAGALTDAYPETGPKAV